MKIKKYYFYYTVVFIILFGVCYGRWFIAYDKAFFRTYDGLDQHYLIYLYIGRWIREVFHNIFVEHRFLIPMWDMAIGYGSDIPTSLGAYLFDPFNWTSALISESYAEDAFAVTLVIKMYLSGIAYSCFSFYKKRDSFSTLIGAIIYTFSATMYIIFVQSFFVNPMYIFPFLMIGVEKIWNKEKPYFYIIVLAISFMNYFYFAYMMSLFVFFYCCLKYLTDRKIRKSGIKTFLFIAGKFIVFSLIGIGISMIVVLPIASVLMGAERLQLNYNIPMWYNKSYYAGVLSGFISSFWMESKDCIIGFGAIVLPCIILLFLHKKEFFRIKIAFFLLSIGLCVPYIGHILNGFSYPANRWIWAYCFCTAYIVTIMIPRFQGLSHTYFYLLFFYSVLYFGIIQVFFKVNTLEISIIELFVFLFCIYAVVSYRVEMKRSELYFIILAMISVSIPSYFYFNIHYKNSLNSAVNRGSAYGLVMNSGAMPLLKNIDNTQGERYDEHGIRRVRNASWLYGISGMDFYISIYNNRIDQFHNNLAVLTSPWSMGYAGIDRRAELEFLMGVNYYLIPNSQTAYLPYGYDYLINEMQIKENIYQLYGANQKNSIILAYDKAISKEEYQNLTPYERQQILMQACVLDSSFANEEVKNLVLKNDSVSYTLELSKDIKREGEWFYVNKAKEQMILKFDEMDASELYLFFEYLDYNSKQSSSYSVSVQGRYNGSEIKEASSQIDGRTNQSHMYGGKHNWLLNLGYINQPINEIVITFNKAGNYILKNLFIYSKSGADIESAINNFHSVVKDMEVSTNKISADIILPFNQYLYFSVPYSKGWRAYVNGKKTDLLEANDAFMAIQLEKGEYHIELYYRTSGLLLGAIISFFSLGILVILIVFDKYRKNN